MLDSPLRFWEEVLVVLLLLVTREVGSNVGEGTILPRNVFHHEVGLHFLERWEILPAQTTITHLLHDTGFDERFSREVNAELIQSGLGAVEEAVALGEDAVGARLPIVTVVRDGEIPPKGGDLIIRSRSLEGGWLD